MPVPYGNLCVKKLSSWVKRLSYQMIGQYYQNYTFFRLLCVGKGKIVVIMKIPLPVLT